MRSGCFSLEGECEGKKKQQFQGSFCCEAVPVGTSRNPLVCLKKLDLHEDGELPGNTDLNVHGLLLALVLSLSLTVKIQP